MLAGGQPIRYSLGAPARAGAATVFESAGISKVRKLISERYADSLSLDELVAASGLRRFRFLRLFKRETGLSPHEFLIRCRIEKAKQFLSAQMSVLQTAMDTGFFDQSHFCRHFKRITGESPGAYRRSMRSRQHAAINAATERYNLQEVPISDQEVVEARYV